MKLKVPIFFMLFISGCNVLPENNNWCTFHDDSEYIEFVPSEELINGLSKTKNLNIQYRIRKRDKSLLWKKKSDDEIVVCAPGRGFGAPACGSTANHFQNISGEWELDKSELTNCHQAP